jgi:hypothetical protein
MALDVGFEEQNTQSGFLDGNKSKYSHQKMNLLGFSLSFQWLCKEE